MCSAGIRWLMARDTHARFRFAALQDPQVADLIATARPEVQQADSVIFVRDGQFYIYADAVLQALRLLGGGYQLIALAYIFPRGLRNAVYRWVARNRTRWFGRSDSCYFVPPDQRHRFLSDPTRDWSDSVAEEE